MRCAECQKEFEEKQMVESMYFNDKKKTLEFKMVCKSCAKKLRGRKRKIELLCTCCKCKIIGEPFIKISEGKPMPFCCKSCAVHFLTLKCIHCGCLIVENPYVEVIGDTEKIFCCKSCGEAYKTALRDVALRYIG